MRLIIFIFGMIVGVLLYRDYQDEPTAYNIYVNGDELVVEDPHNGNVIHREKMNWNNPIGIQKALIKDNE